MTVLKRMRETLSETEVLVSLVGVGGTLGGVALRQLSAALTGWRQRCREVARRWVSDQSGHPVPRAPVGAAGVGRFSAARSSGPDERLPGHGASLLLLPPMGIAGVIDEIDLSVLREAVEDGFEQLDLLENEVKTFALVADPEAVKAARELVECL